MPNLHSPPERGSHSIVTVVITVVVVVMLLELLLLLLLLLSAFYRWASQKIVSKKIGQNLLVGNSVYFGNQGRGGEWKGRKEKRKKKVNLLVPRKKKKNIQNLPDSTLLILTIQVGHQEFREVGERKVASRQALLSFWHPPIPERGETLGRVHPRGLPQVQDGAEPEGPRLVPLWQACAQHQRR